MTHFERDASFSCYDKEKSGIAALFGLDLVFKAYPHCWTNTTGRIP